MLFELDSRQNTRPREQSVTPPINSSSKKSKKVTQEQAQPERQTNYIKEFFKAFLRLTRRSLIYENALGMYGLLTRAWIIACLLTPARLYGMLTMTIPWFMEQKICSGSELTYCYRPYNEKVLDATADSARIIVQVLIGLSVILCFLSYKWRRIARAFIYIEILLNLATLFYPNSNRAWSSTYHLCIEYGSYFLVFYCGSMRSCYFMMASMVFTIFFNSHVAYLEPIKVAKVLYSIFSAITICIIFVFVATGIDIMAMLHNQIQLTNSEQIKMLDGMHEGLIIINKPKLNRKTGKTSTHSVAFSNRSAQNLIGGFVGHGLENKTADSFAKLSKLKSFAPMKKANKQTFEYDEPISLEQIILGQLDELSQKHNIYRLQKVSENHSSQRS